jgi:hypothetical protein
MITNLVIRNFGLLGEEDDKPSEEVIFQMLCDKIAWLIEHNMEYLLSLLYRNDVPESKIYKALLPDNPDPANIALAKLVIERQKQRLETKKEFGKQDASDVEEELRW